VVRPARRALPRRKPVPGWRPPCYGRRSRGAQGQLATPEAAARQRPCNSGTATGAVRVHRQDQQNYALLMERCEPGDTKAQLTTSGLRSSCCWAPTCCASYGPLHPRQTGLEHLKHVTAEWAGLVQARMDGCGRLRSRTGSARHPLLQQLPKRAGREVVLMATSTPARAHRRRQPWLAIDAKPMTGDPGYDPWRSWNRSMTPSPTPTPAACSWRFTLLANALDQEHPAPCRAGL